jgi:GDPmannose 4,6-dehydratase
MKNKTAIVTGNGQDSNYLAAFLLKKGYKVVIASRRSGSNNGWRAEALGISKHPSLSYETMDITDFSSVVRVIKKYKPKELYHLAAQSFVGSSFEIPLATSNTNAIGTLHILEALREYSRDTRMYNASTSEMFGKTNGQMSSESSPFYPRSPYGVAKLFAHEMVKNYRETYNMFCCSGILFNHESPLRGEVFVTRKITKGLSLVKKNMAGPLQLGNIYAKRDWGFAGDFVNAMWLMLHADKPEDYVVATGTTHTIKVFINMAAEYLFGNDTMWYGDDLYEKLYLNDKPIVEISKEFYRPCEVDFLLGDSSKIRKELGWKPEVDLYSLVDMMCDYDYLGYIK